MTDLEQLAMDLRQRTQWQQTPVEMTEADYLEIARQAVRHLYVMTGALHAVRAGGCAGTGRG